MIPKTIHYCWFGGNPKPKLAKKCIKSWKKYCKGYEIIEWNESNYDISSAPLYVRQAYEAKKWAFVTDYVRLDVVYRCGGIYLDTDVEITRKWNSFLQYDAFFGFEDDKYVNTGLGFGAVAENPFVKEMRNEYSSISFTIKNNQYDITPCPERNTEVFKKHGLLQNGLFQIIDDKIAVFPKEFFCPLSYITRKLDKTKNTYAIHWYSASWWDEQTRQKHKENLAEAEKQRKKEKKQKRKIRFVSSIINVIGIENYEKLRGKKKG